MTGSKKRFIRLKGQAQALFWKCAAGPPVASPSTISAYKAGFLEFLEYAARECQLSKLTQIRKRHLVSYIRYLRKRRFTDYRIGKQIYAVCFWLSQVEQGRMMRLPDFESLCEEYPALAQARYSIRF